MAVKRPDATFPPRVRRYRRERPERRNPAFWDPGATEHHCFGCGKAITAPMEGILAECPECWANLKVEEVPTARPPEPHVIEGVVSIDELDAYGGFDVFPSLDLADHRPSLGDVIRPFNGKRVRVTVQVLE